MGQRRRLVSRSHGRRPGVRRSTAPVVFVLLTAFTGCAADAPTASPTTPETVQLPPTQGVFDYQLGDAYDLVQTGSGEHAPDVVVRDATATAPTTGYGICYVNGFQTQPGRQPNGRTPTTRCSCTTLSAGPKPIRTGPTNTSSTPPPPNSATESLP